MQTRDVQRWAGAEHNAVTSRARTAIGTAAHLVTIEAAHGALKNVVARRDSDALVGRTARQVHLVPKLCRLARLGLQELPGLVLQLLIVRVVSRGIRGVGGIALLVRPLTLA